MSICSKKISQNKQIVIDNSGFQLQQLGNYEECKKLKPAFTYNLLKIALRNGALNNIGYIGLCLPSQCQPRQITQYTNQLFRTIHLPASILSVNNKVIYSVPANQLFKYAFWLITVLVILLLYSTILKYFKCRTFLYMFSAQETSKYFKSNSKSPLNIFNGLKSIGMFLVISVHFFKNGAYYSKNIFRQQNYLQKPYFLIINHGQTAVAVFLYISGFLASYVVIKQMKKSNWTCILNIFHRAFRILPALLFAIMFRYGIFPQMGSGIFWFRDMAGYQNCSPFWKVYLFWDNFRDNGRKMCFPMLWYLYVDMQLYAASLVILLFYKYLPRITKLLILGLPYYGMTQLYKYSIKIGFAIPVTTLDMRKSGNSFFDQYCKPWKWMAAYFLGLFLGILYYQYLEQTERIKNQLQNSNNSQIKRHKIFSKFSAIFKRFKCIRIFVQLLGVCIVLFYVYVPRTLQQHMKWSVQQHALYQSTVGFGCTLGISCIILPTLLGCQRSIVGLILNTKIFNFIGKISFLTYLLHINFVRVEQLAITSTYYYQIIPRFTTYVYLCMISMFVAFLATVLIQAPIGAIHKFFLQKIRQICYPKKLQIQMQQLKEKQHEQSQLRLDSEQNQIKQSSFSQSQINNEQEQNKMTQTQIQNKINQNKKTEKILEDFQEQNQSI